MTSATAVQRRESFDADGVNSERTRRNFRTPSINCRSWRPYDARSPRIYATSQHKDRDVTSNASRAEMNCLAAQDKNLAPHTRSSMTEDKCLRDQRKVVSSDGKSPSSTVNFGRLVSGAPGATRRQVSTRDSILD
jgi:hypothetical protein